MVVFWFISVPVGIQPRSIPPKPPSPEPSPSPFPVPSPSPFWLSLQPKKSTDSPIGVSGQVSSSSITPSPSASSLPLSPLLPLLSSSGQPSLSASFWELDASLGQASLESGIPSPSVSSSPPPLEPPPPFWASEQPNASTSAPSIVPGQSSQSSDTPSQSSSGSPQSSVQLLPDVLIVLNSLLVSITLDTVTFS